MSRHSTFSILTEKQLSPDTRQHRGAHPADKLLFSEERLPLLRTATAELSWLLTRGYKMASSLKLVGDRYSLTARQRLAVSRAACSDQAQEQRRCRQVSVEDVAGQAVIIDGFNLIITVEAALSGGVLILCRDECVRDLSSVHGSYRAVSETESAIHLIGEALEDLKPASVLWLLDRPVSNSGRLANRIRDLAAADNWRWSVDVVFNPDKQILQSRGIAVTSDSSILDQVDKWSNLSLYLLDNYLPLCWLLDLKKA
jgi:hypothetical protein